MRFKQIIENSTTAGSVATVAQPMMTQTRESVDVKGLKPVQQVMKGTKKKGPYANSIVESKVTEDDLAEQDLIIIPGQGRLKRTGFVKHDLDQGEHEGHTLKNSLHTIARAASDLDKRLSVQSEFPEWVSEKIGAAKGMMVSVMDYLISSQEMQHDRDNMEEGLGESVSFREMVNVVDEHYPKYYAELSGSDISDEQFEKKIINAYKKIMKKQGMSEGDNSDVADISDSDYMRIKGIVDKKYPGYELSGLTLGRDGNIDVEIYNYKTHDTKDLKTKSTNKQGMSEGKIDFAKKLQGKVDKHNKAVVKTKQAVGSRVADIGAGGKEHNEKTDAAWDAAKKKVSEGYKKK